MGTSDGSIIVTIITTHMPRNDAAAPGHVCPGIRIHAIDIVQPPGIGISAVAGMDADQTVVSAAQMANSDDETPMKTACRGARSTMGAQRSPYSSWRRHQTPVSFRPFGARSNHWYMPQSPSR